MKLLCIDTATENCSVALLNEDVISYKAEITAHQHAEMLLPMIDELLKENKIDKKDLTGLALGVGPGSFTGVRVGASCVQGLALALDLKVARITSLFMLAQAALAKSTYYPSYVISAIDARMDEVYLGVYKVVGEELLLIDHEAVLSYRDAYNYIKLNTHGSLIGAGTGLTYLVKEGLEDCPLICEYPSAMYALTAAKKIFQDNLAVDAAEALPLYVRNEVTWKKVSEQ